MAKKRLTIMSCEEVRPHLMKDDREQLKNERAI